MLSKLMLSKYLKNIKFRNLEPTRVILGIQVFREETCWLPAK